MPLALVELEVALSELFKRLPNLRLAVSPSQIKWSDPKGDVGVQVRVGRLCGSCCSRFVPGSCLFEGSGPRPLGLLQLCMHAN